MGFKMKGFPKPFKKTQKSSFRQTSEGYSDIDEDAYYLGKDELGETPDTPEVSNEEYWNTKKKQEQRRDAIENTKTTGGRVLDAMMTLPGFSHINYLRMHKKWAKFHNGFGGPGGVRQIPADASPEQRVQKMNAQQQAEDFKKRHNMSDNDFNALMNKAKATKFTLDDVYHVLNKERVSEGVANSTKKDMLSQMQNVRDIPTSEAGVNSAPKGEEKPDDKVFDAILGLDSTFDELFG